MTEIAIRTYARPKKNHPNRLEKEPRSAPDYSTVFVFDTETTADGPQHLKFGSFVIKKDDVILLAGLFYDKERLDGKEFDELRQYTSNHPILKLYTREEFIENVFYPYAYDKEVPVIGFNLPFDLSMLGTEYCSARKGMKNGFVIKLCQDETFPGIRIKHNSSNQAFISFQAAFSKNNLKEPRSKRKYGVFLDLKTLAVTLTDKKHINLEKACEKFNKRYFKKRVKEHGKVTEGYIDYNIDDVLATAELFTHLKEEYEKYGVKLPMNEVYSSASIGKHFLGILGIKSFSKQNPKFPKRLLALIMGAYYGGRCECRVRKTPIKVDVLDFTSQYPTTFILLGLWDFLTAERVDYKDDTENIIRFLDKITIAELRKPETWKKLCAIVELEPDHDLLSVRSKYNGETYNVGLNYLTSKETVPYTLAEVVLSKLSTGKTPKIKRAIRFAPIGKQKTLLESELLGMKIDPQKDNPFKKIVEERQRRKKNEDESEKAIKIVTNAAAYGIFIEMNPECNNQELEVYGKEVFECEAPYEKPGKSFNPIVGALITGGAKLLLGLGDCILKEHDSSMVYCDTDSMFVPPKYSKEIMSFFDTLNPYSNVSRLLKREERGIWFYGISAKRYVLYRINKNRDFIIKDKEDKENYSLHGLGHLLNPFGDPATRWQKEVWVDILKLHYGKITLDELISKYSNFYAISEFTASSPNLLHRFDRYNEKFGKDGIIPFDFFLIGFGNNKEIKPLAPFSKRPQEAPHKDFVDYKTGNVMNGPEYWCSLSDLLLKYLNHLESKFDGDTGLLERRHVIADKIIYIGKEANRIEENTAGLEAPITEVYQSKADLRKKILGLTLDEAKELRVSKRTFYRLKDKVSNGKVIKLRNKTIKRL